MPGVPADAAPDSAVNTVATRTSPAERNRRARERFDASGVVPVFVPDRRVILVASRTDSARLYTVQVQGVGRHPVVHCDCPAGKRAMELGYAAGSTPCWHGAGALREMERHGLVAWDDDGGHWHLTVKGLAAPPAVV